MRSEFALDPQKSRGIISCTTALMNATNCTWSSVLAHNERNATHLMSTAHVFCEPRFRLDSFCSFFGTVGNDERRMTDVDGELSSRCLSLGLSHRFLEIILGSQWMRERRGTHHHC
jgi:hypothetical protein